MDTFRPPLPRWVTASAVAPVLVVLALLVPTSMTSGVEPTTVATAPSSDPRPAPAPIPPANGTSGGSSLAATSTCNPTGNPTPSAILIPAASPTSSLPAGGTISATYELEILNYSTADAGTVLYVPSAFAIFPLAGATPLSLYLPARSILINASGWTSPSLATVSVTESNGATFSTTASPSLSTEKLAVMGSTLYGGVGIGVRWQWTLTAPSGSPTSGAWTTPTAAWTRASTGLPSEFYPAPRVTVASTNGPKVAIGTNFSGTLGGFVSGRYFFLELEFPSTGKVVQAHGQTSPSGATSFVVTIPMLNYNRYLAAGTYLVHIHDGCGAMLYSLSETAYYASSVSVAISVSPSSCGSVTLNGSSYANGAVATIAASATPYSLSVRSCTGNPTISTSTGGAVTIPSAGKLLVDGGGSLAVRYS